MVSCDTMVMIWGVKQVASDGQEYMIGRTKRLLEKLKDQGSVVAVAAPVVAEYLGGFPPETRPDQFRVLRESFPILPFDAKAAEIASDLLYRSQLIKGIQEEFKVSRQVVKADIKIIAASVAHGATTLYTSDKKLVKTAHGTILVKEIPDLPAKEEQGSLFCGKDE